MYKLHFHENYCMAKLLNNFQVAESDKTKH